MPADGLAKVYLFGPFRLEVLERRLLRGGEAIPLPGKPFDTLVQLVEGAGTLQRQQALIDRLWPDVTVDQNNLQQNISLVRRALGDAAGVEIETVRGQGYRLHAVVREAAAVPAPASAPPPPRSQQLQFCPAADGARLAYASLGDGPPIVKAANWLNHLELDLEGPMWRHWLGLLSRDHCLIRYDARGNGLSDWRPPSIRFEDFVSDLGFVFDAAGVRRAPVFAVSQGTAVAAAFAARHPERVSALILVGGCARGWRVKQNPRLTQRVEALMVLMAQGWGAEHAAFRHIFTSSFYPAGTKAQMDWFNELQRRTTSPENAVEILSAVGDLDVRDELPRVKVPTLVLHSRGDRIVPIKDGIELAAGIAGARFVALDSDNHLLVEDEPAWSRMEQEIDGFLSEIEASQEGSAIEESVVE